MGFTYKDDPTIAAQYFPFDLQGPPAASTEISATVTPESLSPADHGKLAYVQAGDIWVQKLPDGEGVRLTTDGQNQEPRQLSTDANYRDELFDWRQD